MGTLLSIAALLVFIALLLVAAMHPIRPRYTLAELRRRSGKTGKTDLYSLEIDRLKLHVSLVTLFRIKRAVLLVLETCLLIGAFGWAWGITASILIAVTYPGLARIRPVTRAAQSLYRTIEPTLLDIAAKCEKVLKALREPAQPLHEPPFQFDSREELAEVIARSHDVIGQNERLLLASALEFPDKKVAAIMTPRSEIAVVKHTEFLGPLVLSELHTLGHSRLPVIDKDIDHIIGILHLRDMLSLDSKRSVTAEKAMEKKVYYVDEDDTLEHTLSLFIQTRHHLCIVTNKQKDTVGLVSLEDVIEALVGRRMIDEKGNDTSL